MINVKKYAEDFFEVEKPASKSDWERVYHTMIVHTRGVHPKKLLELKRPNEPQEVREYRLANYKPITKHGINQAIDAIYRVLTDSNYAVTYSDNLFDYLEDKQFSFLGERLKFKQLFFRHVLRIIFDDPNGLLVWMPEHPTDPTLRPIEAEGNEPIEVKPVYVSSPKIMHYTDEVISYEAEGKWAVEVPYGAGKTKTEYHPFYYILTKTFIYRLIPFYSTGKKKIQYELQEYYNLSQIEGENDIDREFPTFVAHQLGGNISISDTGHKYYDSFYGAYAPFADDAICAYSDNQAVRVRYNFPFTSIKGQLCVSCKGVGKIVSKEDYNKGKKVMCSTCNGSGKTVPFTPFGQYVKEPPTPNDNEAFVASPAVEFYSPDVSILQNSYETWKDLLSEAKKAVNIVFTEEAQSGVAKEIDREQRYESLIKISNNFFELMQWSLEIIEAYRVPFVDDRDDNVVRAPQTFSIKTAGQLSEELNDMISKESPISYIATTAKRLAEKIYSDDTEAQIIVDVLTIWDPLFGKTASQIATLKATGGASTNDVMRNVHGYSILARLAQDNDFEQLDYQQIILLAETELNRMMPQTTIDAITPQDT